MTQKNFSLKNYHLNENLLPRRGSNPGPAEPEADMLPSEAARRARIKNIEEAEIVDLQLHYKSCIGGAEIDVKKPIKRSM